jgi:hypothetical protein
VTEAALISVLSALRGKDIWYVNCGGSVGSSFSLCIGEKIPREPAMDDPNSDEFSLFRGEYMLYVWCTWRVDIGSDVASSDQSVSTFASPLRQLSGSRILSSSLSGRFNDLQLATTKGYLDVFCDHVPPESSFDGNWELVFPEGVIYVGPGVSATLEPTTTSLSLNR